MAVPKEFGLSLIIDKRIQPDPVPTSNIFLDDLVSIIFNISSTMISVSGRGIKTFLLTQNLLFQNSFFLRIYAIGSFFILLCRSFL